MIIKLERSGGFTGIPISVEFNSEDLPSALTDLVKKIMENKQSNALPLRSTPKGAADHYTYKISIVNGKKKRTMICDQYAVQDDLMSLIKQLEKFSKKT